MDIHFSDTVASTPVIVYARAVAGNFKNMFEAEMAEVLKNKNYEWHHAIDDRDELSQIIEIGDL